MVGGIGVELTEISLLYLHRSMKQRGDLAWLLSPHLIGQTFLKKKNIRNNLFSKSSILFNLSFLLQL